MALLKVQCVECGKPIHFERSAVEEVARKSIATLIEVAKVLGIDPHRVIMRAGILCEGCELTIPEGTEVMAEGEVADDETRPTRLN